MVVTYDVEKKRKRKALRKHLIRKKLSLPIRPQRSSTAALPPSSDVVSCFYFLKLSREISGTAAKRFKVAENKPDFDSILLPNTENKDDVLYLTKEQIDEMFQIIQTAANNRYRVTYLSADEIVSDAPPLPSTEDTDIIIVPLPLEINGQINLTVFNLLTSTAWVFCRYYRQSMFSFNRIKNVLEQNYNIKFVLKPKKSCDMLINTLSNSYNDAILVFRTAEELFFTGSVKKFAKFDHDAERKRYSEIYDMIHLDDWDGVWPPTLQRENREIIEPEEEEENDGTTRNQTFVTSSSNDIQVVESSENGGGTNTSRDQFNEARSSISDFYDFDDVQPQHSPVPNPFTFDSFSSDSTQSSSFLDSNSINVVNDQLNAPVLSHNCQQLSSLDSRATPSTDHHEITSSLAENTSNENYQPIYGPFLPPLEYNHIIEKWRRSLSPEECPLGEPYEYSSLSSIGSSSESEDDEEINDGLSPRYYNDPNDSSDEEKINFNSARILTENCRAVNCSFYYYWECIRKLVEDRQKINRKVVKRLPETLIFCDDEEVLRINSLIDLIEHDINMFIPVVPRWKVSYQKDSDRKIIIRKGYIYERIGETNEFQCVYKESLISQCSSFITIDNSDMMIEGSFCYHNHPAAENEEYTNDVPSPAGTPILFQRVTKDGTKFRKYPKLIEFLKETLTELIKWKQQAIICSNKLKLLQKYLDDLNNIDHPNNKYGFQCKMVFAEASNLLNCVRLDK